MPNLSAFTRKDQYHKLVASEKINASGGTLMGEGGRLQPDTTNRTVFVGLGGNGIKTINHIKGVISKRLAPEWTDYIAFLGIDTDRHELEGAKYLSNTECICTTCDNANKRFEDRTSYPDAALRFVPEDPNSITKTLMMPDLSLDGANQKRLVGRVKLHDKPAASEPVDVQVVNSVENAANRMEPLGNSGAYEVYVIGSTCGGTCSGAFMDMPSLIRKALVEISGNRLNIHAILYLPDALPGKVDSKTKQNLQANGYASLKELNYYQAMKMRDGYSETWSYNDDSCSELSIASNERTYVVPYLIGSPGASSDNSLAECREVIAEFLISILAQMNTNGSNAFLTKSFMANALDDTHWINRPTDAIEVWKERKDTYHDFPKCFSSIGFAKANAPQDIVRAYQVNKISRDAGICPLTQDEREIKAASAPEGTLLPFRAADDYMNSTVGSAAIKDIMQPLNDLMQIINRATFRAEANMGNLDLTFDGLKNPATIQQMDMISRTYIDNNTNADVLDELKRQIIDKFGQFRTNVQAFVRKEGPFAYVNLFDGNMIVKNGEVPRGIKTMLEDMIIGKNMNGSPCTYLTIENTENAKVQAASELQNLAKNIFDRLIPRKKFEEASGTYLNAYSNHVNAQIIKPKRDAALGVNGYLQEYFFEPANRLRNELKSFGEILEVLGGVYADHGKKMETFQNFQEAEVGTTNVNMAAITQGTYNWLKKKADDAALTIQGINFRNALVNHFFTADNNQKWLEVPDRVASQDTTGNVTMKYDDAVIPAREIFDSLAAKVLQAPVEVTVLDMFKTLKAEGMTYDAVAKMIIDRLAARSKPRYKGGAGHMLHQYIMYPKVLSSGVEDGAEIANALRAYATHKFPGIGVYTSDDADGIMFYQQVTGMEIYQLSELSSWEKAYEAKVKGNDIPKIKGNLLHGASPDTVMEEINGRNTFTETISWVDYPSICPTEDPERPDPTTGRVSREGQMRAQIRNVMKEALKLGVIFREQDENGLWHYYRVHCDRTVAEWKFSMTSCRKNELGLLPLGKDLAQAVAAQNGKSLEVGAYNSIVKPIALEHAGQLSKLYSNEQVAFEYALRILRVHVPMYVEILKTLRLFRQWSASIVSFNHDVQELLRPAKMAYLMRGRVLYRDEQNVWLLKNSVGGSDVVANLSEDMLMFDFEAQAMVDNSLVGYYIYQKINSMLPGDMLDDACRFATQEMKVLQMSKDMDAMKAGLALVAEMEQEAVALQTKGAQANADKKTPILATFANYMNTTMGFNQSEAKDVELFYARLPMYKTLRPTHFGN